MHLRWPSSSQDSNAGLLGLLLGQQRVQAGGETVVTFGEVNAMKHVFDIIHYPSLDHVAGRPRALWVHGNNDTVGAANTVDKVATGLA